MAQLPIIQLQDPAANLAQVQWKAILDNLLGATSTTLGLVAQIYFSGGGASWGFTSSTLARFSPVTAISPTIEIAGSIGTPTTTATQYPLITIQNLPAGTYAVTSYATVYPSVAYANLMLAIWDGFHLSGHQYTSPNNAGTGQIVVPAIFNYDKDGNRTFEIYGSANAGSGIALSTTGVSRIIFNVSKVA